MEPLLPSVLKNLETPRFAPQGALVKPTVDPPCTSVSAIWSFVMLGNAQASANSNKADPYV